MTWRHRRKTVDGVCNPESLEWALLRHSAFTALTCMLSWAARASVTRTSKNQNKSLPQSPKRSVTASPVNLQTTRNS